MFLIQYIPMLEVLFFNLFAINKCCHKKYSAAKTVLVLFLWSALLLVISIILWNIPALRKWTVYDSRSFIPDPLKIFV